MKVGILSPEPLSSGGGVERFCWLVSEGLTARGHSVDIVGPDAGRSRRHERVAGHWMRLSRSGGRALDRLDSDVLVSNGFLGLGVDASRRRIHVYHGVFPARTIAADGNHPLRERARRLVNAGFAEGLAGRNATVVAVSRSAARQVRRFYGRDDTVVIPNCVDTAKFTPGSRSEARDYFGLPQKARIALFVGRLEYTKGGDLVAEGAARAGFDLAVAGGSAPPGAHHLGLLDGEALVYAYRAADCVVLPSRYEACSLAGLEALATGVPLVCSRVGWFEDLFTAVPDYEAMACETNVASLASALRRLAAGPPTKAIGEARDLVRREHSLQVFGQRWGRIVERVGGA